MKNLIVHGSKVLQFDQMKGAKSALIIGLDDVSFATDRHVWRLNVRDGTLTEVVDLSTTIVSLEHNPTITCYEYVRPWDSFVVCCSNGNVLLVQENEVEDAFTCEGPVHIVDLLCSPDFERVALLDNEGKMTLVSECFEVVRHFSVLADEAETENALVNLGWGKKETQFHGSEGKDKRAMKNVVGDGVNADRSVNICWRSDSLFFAVGYFKQTSNLRSIKIFNKDGNLQNISEPLPGVEAVLSWKTTKELLSFPQRVDGKYIVSFMEKNGLKHGELVIPPTISVKQLLWNEDSSILCILCNGSDGSNNLLFLTCTNYAWRIKKWITVDHKAIAAKWLHGNYLLYITADGILYTLQMREKVTRSCQGTFDWVAVIDYCTVLLTPFRIAIVPPPMAYLKLVLDCPVDSVLFLPLRQNLTGNNICVITTDKTVHLYQYLNNIYTLKRTIKCIPNIRGLFSHWFWLDDNTLLFNVTGIGSDSHVCFAKFDEPHVEKAKCVVEMPVLSIINYKHGALIQLASKKAMFWNEEDDKLHFHSDLPEEFVESVNVVDGFMYGLSVSNKLYESKQAILFDIESFCLSYPFLLATTSKQKLIAYNLFKDKIPEYFRSIESGSKIIAVSDNSVILQLPRGNLETIKPRPLTILSVVELIRSKKFLCAFRLLRKERINLNVICDLDPIEFLDDLNEFIVQIDDSTWISLFITELEDKNYLNTVYASQFQEDEIEELENKVSTVCSHLIKALNEFDVDKYAFPLLGCYVKLKQIDLALNLASVNNKNLKHLLFLVDVDVLYKTSLANYDLKTAMKIINNSQLDPKEYVPFLKELENMEFHNMRFTIDDKLGNKESALKNLVQCKEEFDKCLKYIQDNNLYFCALTLFDKDKNEYKIIAKHFGDLLYSKHDYKQAALVYNLSADRHQAISAYLNAGFWKESLELSHELKIDDSELKQVKAKILMMLSSTQQFKEAADFVESELKDTKLAVEYSIKAQDYAHALYLARSRSILDKQLEDLIKSACLNAAENLISDLKSQNDKFVTLAKRLDEVRESKKIQPPPTKFSAYPSSEHAEHGSTVSYCNMSSSTRTSCRSARKQHRKMWNLKKGNFREEPTLIITLKQTVETLDKLKDDVKKMCFVLARLEELDTSRKVQVAFDSFETCVLNHKSTIWPIFAETSTNIDQTLEDNILLSPLNIIPDKSWKLSILE